MAGWMSRYDYPGQSNLEKLSGRKLHLQDNCWYISKVLIIILIGFVVYFNNKRRFGNRRNTKNL